MTNAFSDFAEAASKASVSKNQPEVPTFDKVAVLGGGEDGQLIAALCLASNAEVTLFSAYGKELEALRTSSGISIRGSGPVGTYQIDRNISNSIQTTAELDNCIKNANVIFLTGPVHKQRTYAMVLADHISDGQVLVLAPGRSLGAIETAWHLRIGGCKSDITIVECQGLPYWVKAEGTVLHLSPSGLVAAATLPSGRTRIISSLIKFFPNLSSTASVLNSGFADGSALVEFPALLFGGPAMNNGAIKVPMGGTPLSENQNFASLIGKEQLALINQLAKERRQVAKSFGVRDLPTTEEWVKTHAGTIKDDVVRSVPDQFTARNLLRCGVVGSLVPLFSAAKIAKINVPLTESMINIASSILGADVAAAGRRLDNMGITSTEIENARQMMDAIAMGTR